jgi:hypothetical protein
MLEMFVIITANQGGNGKEGPMHLLKAEHMETFKTKEDIIKTITDISTFELYKNVVVKNIYSVNEFGSVMFYDVIFNGKFYLKECANPFSNPMLGPEDDLPFCDIDKLLDDDEEEMPKRAKPIKKRLPKGTCSTCNNTYENCTCHPGCGDDDDEDF